MNKLVLIMLATLIVAAGAVMAVPEAGAQAASVVQEQKAPEAAAAEAPAAEKSGETKSLWQKFKNMLTPAKDTKAPEAAAEAAPASTETKAPEAAVQAAPASADTKAPVESTQAAPVVQEQKAPEAAAAEAPAAGTSGETKSLWQKIKSMLTPSKDAKTPDAGALVSAGTTTATDSVQESPVTQETVTSTDKAQAAAAMKEAEPAKPLQRIVDMRMKFGSAAGLDKLELYGTTYSGAGSASDNLQLEADMGLYKQSSIGLVLSAGVFKRKHAGSAEVGLNSTSIRYDATGVSVGAGAALKATEQLHFEGKFELGMGAGQPTFSAPGVVWNQSKNNEYRSTSFILGGYYTFPSRLQVGLELGTQSFIGYYSIMNNSSQWILSKVEGGSSTANVLVGYRF